MDIDANGLKHDHGPFIRNFHIDILELIPKDTKFFAQIKISYNVFIACCMHV